MLHKESSTLAASEITLDAEYANLFTTSVLSTEVKLENFPKYVKRQNLTYFLTKYELFKKILNVHGSIVECGVLYGGGLLSWAQMSAILEPVNHNRKIIGFDTFEGFQSVSKSRDNVNADLIKNTSKIDFNQIDEIKKCLELYDKNRNLPHIPKVELVKGDLTKSAEEYVKNNPHLVVSLLYLDCDIYEPTLAALKAFVPRMPKGAVIVFDELNCDVWPGETMAVLDEMGLRNLRIQRFSYESMNSFAVLE